MCIIVGRIVWLFVCLLFIGSVRGQISLNDLVSPEIRTKLEQHLAVTLIQVKEFEASAKRVEDRNKMEVILRSMSKQVVINYKVDEPTVDVLIMTTNAIEVLDDPKTIDAVFHKGDAENFVAATIKIEDLEAFTDKESVIGIEPSYKVYPELDESAEDISADLVWYGNIDIPDIITGEGVYVGIIDKKPLRNHITFNDESGNTRFLNDFDTSNPDDHGTHVTGIAVGRGNENGMFKGIAYNSQIYWKQLSFSNQTLIDFQWMIDQSGTNPLVVNYSAGYFGGPHDGSTYFETALNNKINGNKIFVKSAGNNGYGQAHCRSNVPDNDTLQIDLLISLEGSYEVNFYYSSELSFEIRVRDENSQSQWSSWVSEGSVFTYDCGSNDDDFIKIYNDSLYYINYDDSGYHADNINLIHLHYYSNDTLLDYGTYKIEILPASNSIGGVIDGYISTDDGISFINFTIADNFQTITSPGYASKVITVAASSKQMYDGDIAYYSSKGPSRIDTGNSVSKPDITAPGGDSTDDYNSDNDLIQSASETDTASFENHKQGTSMAAPHVTGAIALLLQNFPELTADDVKIILKNSAAPIPNGNSYYSGTLTPDEMKSWGAGKLDILAAYKSMVGFIYNATFIYKDKFQNAFNDIANPEYSTGLPIEPVEFNWGGWSNIYKQKLTNGAIFYNESETSAYWIGEQIWYAWIARDSVNSDIGLPVTTEYPDTTNNDYPTVDFQYGKIYRDGTNTVVIVRHLELSTNPTAIYADGTSTSTITAVVKDSSGNTITDSPFEVTFTIISGSTSAHLEGTNPDSTVNGVAEITLRADTTPGIVKIEVSAEGLKADTVNAYVCSNASDIVVSDPIMLDTSSTSPQGNPAAAFDGTNYFIVWEDYRHISSRIYGVRLSSSGQLSDSSALLTIPDETLTIPDIVYGGLYYLVFGKGLSSSFPNAYARVSSDGTVIDSPAIQIPMGQASPYPFPCVSHSGSNYIAVTQSISTEWVYIINEDGSNFNTAQKSFSGYTSDIAFNGNYYQLVCFSSDIQTARIDIFGHFLDGQFISVCSDGGDQINPSIASDNNGFLVVWEDRREINDYNIYGARINNNGEVIDNPAMVISDNPFCQQNPSVGFDGTNYWIIWEDSRDQSGTNLYGTRVTPEGIVLDPQGVKLIDRDGSCYNPHLTKGPGEQILIVYSSYEPNQYDTQRIFASIIGGIGSLELTDVFGAPGSSTSQSSAIFKSNTPVANLQFTMNFNSLISVDSVKIADQFSNMNLSYNTFSDSVTVLISGNTIQPNNEPIVYFYYSVSHSAPINSIVPLTLSNVLVSDANNYQIPISLQNGNFYIKPENIDFIGHLACSTNPTVMYADGSSTSTITAVVKGVNDETVSIDSLMINFSIISGNTSAHLVGTNPTPTIDGIAQITLCADDTPGIVKVVANNEGLKADTVKVYVCSDPSMIVVSDPIMLDTSSTSYQDYPAVAFDDTNYFIVWNSGLDIYGIRLSTAGQVLDNIAIPVLVEPSDHLTYPDIIFGGNYYLVACHNNNHYSDHDPYYTRVSPTGEVIDSPPRQFTYDPGPTFLSYSGNTYIAIVGRQPSTWGSTSNYIIDESGNIVAHLNGGRMESIDYPLQADISFNGNHYQFVWRHNYDISTIKIDIFGNVLDQEIIVDNSLGDQLYPSIASDGNDFFVIWEDRSEINDYNIYGARINNNGEVLDNPAIVISDNPFCQQNPSIEFDGTNYWVIWEDNRDQSGTNLYGTRVSPEGIVLDPTGVKLVDRDGSCFHPHLSKGPGEQLLVVYNSYEPLPYNTQRIFASILGGTISLKLTDASGAPGTSTSWSTAIVNSPEPISTLQFTMNFNSLISLDSLKLADEFSNMDFNCNIFSDSAIVLIYSTSGNTIQPNNEPIVHFYYSVSIEAPFGEIFPLTLSNVVIADAYANAMATSLKNGNFYVTSKGDINFDGVVNALDLQRCINIILDRPPSPSPAELLTGDVAPVPSGDGSVNVLDVIAIANIILGRSERALIASRSTNLNSEVILTVENSFGTPGSTNNPVVIRLSNDLSVAGLQFTLFFEDSLLTIDSVSLSPRSSNMGYDCESFLDSLKILVYSGSGESILPDTGSVVTIFFSVTENANPDESTPLAISGIVVGDPNANPISTTGEDGVFYFNIVPSTATVSLGTNWNLVSWDLDTANDSLETLLSNILENIVVVLGFENGGLTYDPNWPQSSNLQFVDHLHGYWIKMTDVNTLNVIGWPVPDNAPISMEEGWNLVSYLPDYSDSLAHALASIMDSVVVVLGFNDGGLTYGPNWPQFSNLKILSPGLGYWIKMTGPGSLVYPSTQVAKRGLMVKGTANISPGSRIIPTNEWMSVFGDDVIFCDKPLKIGTVIQVKDPDGVICGEYVVENVGRFGMMPIYRDDPATEFDEGANPGDEVRIYFDGDEVDESITWSEFGEIHQIGIKPLRSIVPSAYSLSQNFPNPFNPITHISYQLPEPGHVNLSVFNIMGQWVRRLEHSWKEAGYYSIVWDGRDHMGKSVASGIYFYHFRSGSFTKTRKMIILR